MYLPYFFYIFHCIYAKPFNFISQANRISYQADFFFPPGTSNPETSTLLSILSWSLSWSLSLSFSFFFHSCSPLLHPSQGWLFPNSLEMFSAQPLSWRLLCSQPPLCCFLVLLQSSSFSCIKPLILLKPSLEKFPKRA